MKKTLPHEKRDFARKLRSNMTEAEKKLWSALQRRQLGVKFRRQVPIGPYIADFMSHEIRLIVELDNNQPSTSDLARTAFFEAQGLKVVRVLNSDVFNNFEAVRATIRENINGLATTNQSGALSNDANPQSHRGQSATHPRAKQLTHAHEQPLDTVTLSYDDRFRRRITLTGDNGTRFTLDLPKAIQLNEGDQLLLDTGQTIEIRAAAEEVMTVIPNDPGQLARIAWHVGNRHLPCQILPDRLILRWDHVISDMLEKLHCSVTRTQAPFTPEGGAYGHGRIHSHDH